MKYLLFVGWVPACKRLSLWPDIWLISHWFQKWHWYQVYSPSNCFKYFKASQGSFLDGEGCLLWAWCLIHQKFWRTACWLLANALCFSCKNLNSLFHVSDSVCASTMPKLFSRCPCDMKYTHTPSSFFLYIKEWRNWNSLKVKWSKRGKIDTLHVFLGVYLSFLKCAWYLIFCRLLWEIIAIFLE